MNVFSSISLPGNGASLSLSVCAALAETRGADPLPILIPPSSRLHVRSAACHLVLSSGPSPPRFAQPTQGQGCPPLLRPRPAEARPVGLAHARRVRGKPPAVERKGRVQAGCGAAETGEGQVACELCGWLTSNRGNSDAWKGGGSETFCLSAVSWLTCMCTRLSSLRASTLNMTCRRSVKNLREDARGRGC